MSDKRIRILIVDDHSMVLKGLAATLAPELDMEVVGSASTGPQAVGLYRELRPDVTIMDVSMTPEMTGTEATRAIRREFPVARIVMLSVHQGHEDIYQAFKAGATTYLLKASLGDNLVPLIRDVYAGGKPMAADIARTLTDHMFDDRLTEREVEVLKLIAEGLRNKEIAQRLGITENTTQGHVKSILAKLNVNDRAGAITAAIRRGIIHIAE
jgi:DNA-binding NarL/FixJ family response regulator